MTNLFFPSQNITEEILVVVCVALQGIFVLLGEKRQISD